MKKAVLIIAFFALAIASAKGQQDVPNHTGTDFWVSFLYPKEFVEYYIFIASADTCTAYIENPQSGWDTTVFVNAGEVGSICVYSDTSYVIPYGLSVGDKVWHVTTTAQAVVYASDYQAFNMDRTAVMPTTALRCDYMLQTYCDGSTEGSGLSIAAPYDSTVVSIRFASDNPYVNLPGDTTVLLMRGEECRLRATSFSGTVVHSSKPVAVFQGTTWLEIPGIFEFGSNTFSAADHLYEQCLPIDYWGTQFLVIPITGREPLGLGHNLLGGDFVKITALRDSCIVTIDNTTTIELSSGQTYRFVVGDHPFVMPSYIPVDYYQSEALPISASSPVMVGYYISGAEFAGIPGDPSSGVIPPLERCINRSIIPVKNTLFIQDHTLSIVAPTVDVPLITLDSVPIDTYFAPTPYEYSFARISVSEGVHYLDAHGGKFQAVTYGLYPGESYITVASMALIDNYGLSVSSREICKGDTVTIVVRHGDDTIGAELLVDGQVIVTSNDTIRMAFDSAGQHIISAVFPQKHDTVYEYITVYSTVYAAMEMGICSGDTLLWHGQTLMTEGEYIDSAHMIVGCDSVMSLNLIVHPVFGSSVIDTICDGDSLLWRGRVLFSEGIYTDSLVTANGCDSIISIQLSIAERAMARFTVEADCENYHYSVLGTALGDTVGNEYSWQSTPIDITLEGQPWDSLVLSPSQTTTYSFKIDGYCPFDTAITLYSIRWPVAQMKVQPERLSVDYPSFDAYDMSINANGRTWLVNGQDYGGESVLHYTANTLDDSIWLTLVAANGACVDTLTLAIPMDNTEIWVPNIFTPDGTDNNCFAPVLNECKADGMYIYNRQGFLMAHVEGVNPSWNGIHNGVPCPQGAYVYILYYRTDDEPNRLQKKVGTVMLMR